MSREPLDKTVCTIVVTAMVTKSVKNEQVLVACVQLVIGDYSVLKVQTSLSYFQIRLSFVTLNPMIIEVHIPIVS